MSAGGALPLSIVSHILHVRLPAQTLGLELTGYGRNVRGIDASAADGLAIGGEAGGEKFGELRAIVFGGRIGRLSADQGNVVAEAEVAGAEVVAGKRALAAQMIEVLGRRSGSEGLLITLVFEHDDEHMADRGRSARRLERQHCQPAANTCEASAGQ